MAINRKVVRFTKDRTERCSYDYNKIQGLRHLTERPRIGWEKVYPIPGKFKHKLCVANCAGTVHANLHFDVLACKYPDAQKMLSDGLRKLAEEHNLVMVFETYDYSGNAKRFATDDENSVI